MIIDILFIILVVLAAVKGFQKGIIVAVFSLFAFIIGIAAALKLSAVTAGYIGQTVKVSEQWLPVISFAVVFIIVVLLIRWAALLIQKSAEGIMLGWVNRLGGIVFYLMIYILIYSVLIFYAVQVELLKKETIAASQTYNFLETLGPKVIDGFGKIIPFFKNMFHDLQEFFRNFSEEIPAAA